MPRRHLIVTRFGIGVSRDDYFRSRMELLRLTLAGSLRVQTSENFLWVVATDLRAPDWVPPELESLLPGRVRIWRIDPIATLSMKPIGVEALAEIAGGGELVMTRVDADDFLHRSFVERAQRDLADKEAPFGLSYIDGANLLDRVVYRARYRWVSAGLTTLSRDVAFTPYKSSHDRFGKRAAAAGIGTLEVKTRELMWLRTWHAESDAAEARGHGVDSEEQPTTINPAEYGASPESMERLWATLKSPKSRHEVREANATIYSRLALKTAMLRQIGQMRSAPADPAKERDLAMFTQIFYMI